MSQVTLHVLIIQMDFQTDLKQRQSKVVVFGLLLRFFQVILNYYLIWSWHFLADSEFIILEESRPSQTQFTSINKYFVGLFNMTAQNHLQINLHLF